MSAVQVKGAADAVQTSIQTPVEDGRTWKRTLETPVPAPSSTTAVIVVVSRTTGVGTLTDTLGAVLSIRRQ